MTTRPTAELRRQVVERASNCCEYCLLHQDLAASTHQVDHVIAEKHRGQTSLDNLALSCTVCNRRKGSDIGSIDPQTGNLVSLFNPRTQQWVDHFRLDGVHRDNQGYRRSCHDQMWPPLPKTGATVELLHDTSQQPPDR
jgi:HNH endonuclease